MDDSAKSPPPPEVSTDGAPPPTTNTHSEPNAIIYEKYVGIRRACADVDVTSLAALAISDGGLLDDELRKLACMYYYCFLTQCPKANTRSPAAGKANPSFYFKGQFF